MKSSATRKAISLLCFVVVLLSIIWVLVSVVEQNKSIEAARELEFAINFSPDLLQRDLRFTFALFLGALSIWSRQGAKASLVSALVIFLGIECLKWLGVSSIFSGRIEIEYHLLAGVLIIIGAILWLRGMNYLVTAMLPLLYILSDATLWFASTIRLKELTGVEMLQPGTTLNNVFFGAHWWHLVIIALSMLMLGYEIRCLWTEDFRVNRHENLTRLQT